jgi:hypothetical protein
MSEELESTETATDSDGFIYRIDNGEIVGRNGDDEKPISEVWSVDSDEAAEWVLEQRAMIESRILAINARKKAMMENLDALASKEMRRLSWLEWRFAPSLIAYARKKLRGKERTAIFQAGRVSFRKTGGNNEIIDMKAAVEWMKEFMPEKIKVKETVNITDLLEAKRQSDKWDEEEGITHPTPFLVSSEPSENVTITTGIEINREERTTR